jgi:hypothetical protein
VSEAFPAYEEDWQGAWVFGLIELLNQLAPLVGLRELSPWPPTSPDLPPLDRVRELVEACITRLTALPVQAAPVETPAPQVEHSGPPAEEPSKAPQAGLTARVWAQLQTYGTKGATGAIVAKALEAPYQKVCKALTRFVTQGKATKQGTTYIYCSPEAV